MAINNNNTGKKVPICCNFSTKVAATHLLILINIISRSRCPALSFAVRVLTVTVASTFMFFSFTGRNPYPGTGTRFNGYLLQSIFMFFSFTGTIVEALSAVALPVVQL